MKENYQDSELRELEAWLIKYILPPFFMIHNDILWEVSQVLDQKNNSIETLKAEFKKIDEIHVAADRELPPASIGYLSSLKVLRIDEISSLDELEWLFSQVKHLPIEWVRFTNVKLPSLPTSFFEIQSMTKFWYDGELEFLDPRISLLQRLTEIRVDTRYDLYRKDTEYIYRLTQIPESINDLENLQSLLITSLHLRRFPEQLPSLEALSVDSELPIPAYIREMKHLKRLYITLRQYTDYGKQNFLKDYELMLEGIRQLTQLEEFYMDFDYNVYEVPEWFGELRNLQKLFLYNLNFPVEGELFLPKGIRQLSKLTSLSIVDCFLNQIPEWVGELTELEQLDLRRNDIKSIPETFQRLKKLKRLYISDRFGGHTDPIMILTKEQKEKLKKLLPADCHIEYMG